MGAVFNYLLAVVFIFVLAAFWRNKVAYISSSINRLVNNYTFKSVKDYQLHTASFVRELVLIREVL